MIFLATASTDTSIGVKTFTAKGTVSRMVPDSKAILPIWGIVRSSEGLVLTDFPSGNFVYSSTASYADKDLKKHSLSGTSRVY